METFAEKTNSIPNVCPNATSTMRLAGRTNVRSGDESKCCSEPSERRRQVFNSYENQIDLEIGPRGGLRTASVVSQSGRCEEGNIPFTRTSVFIWRGALRA